MSVHVGAKRLAAFKFVFESRLCLANKDTAGKELPLINLLLLYDAVSRKRKHDWEGEAKPIFPL